MSHYEIPDSLKRYGLSALAFFILFVAAPVHAAGKPTVIRESFEKEPNIWITLVDGVVGKAGKFDGRSFAHLRVNRKTERISIELRFNAADLEASGKAVADWVPLVHPEGKWQDGDVQLVLRDGKASAHIHDGGMNRVGLYTDTLRNNTWYTLRVVMDSRDHSAALYLNDKEVDRKALNPSIRFFSIGVISLGSGNQKKFKGLMDEVTIEIAPFQDVETDDPRNINRGIPITHDELYADQPMIVVTPKGTWICCLTVAPGGEGSRGQHVVAVRSTDGGKTWGKVIAIESGHDGGGYITTLLTPSGRIYGFYNPPHGGAKPPKTEGVRGYFCYKYSDDEGLTWSGRHWLPIRDSAWDLQRDAIREKKHVWCWAIAKPVVDGNDVFLPFAITDGVDGNGAGWIAHSDNIMTETDPARIRWEILPEGREGIRNPRFAPTQEEHCLLPMNRKDMFVCVYRTRLGFPAISYSNDRCRSWSLPEKMTYADGHCVSHPRACPMIWKCRNGKYLFWGHNNSHKSFAHRNPVWISGGIERNGRIFWSRPEILLYVDDPAARMSYPDLVECNDEYWISETDKELPRVHRVDENLLNGIWMRLENDLDRKATPPTQEGLVLDTAARLVPFPGSAARLAETGGLTLDLEVDSKGLKPGTVLLDNRSDSGDGLGVVVEENGSFRFEMNGTDPRGARQEFAWRSDVSQWKGKLQRISIVVDNNPRIVSFHVDGRINDGDGKRDLGWGRYWLAPKDVSGSGMIRLHPSVKRLRLYDRYLRAFEL